MVVLALLLALAAPSSASAARLDGTPIADHPWREPLLDLMNAQRQRRGLPKLKLDRKLNAAAEDRMRDMFARGYFGHESPDGTRPDAAAARRGYRYSRIGENLATGQRSVEQAVRQWMRSRGHRATLLGRFEDAGIAIAEGSPTRGRRGYTFVALFGRE
jgi:uncharacterized protein YkwD